MSANARNFTTNGGVFNNTVHPKQLQLSIDIRTAGTFRTATTALRPPLIMNILDSTSQTLDQLNHYYRAFSRLLNASDIVHLSLYLIGTANPPASETHATSSELPASPRSSAQPTDRIRRHRSQRSPVYELPAEACARLRRINPSGSFVVHICATQNEPPPTQGFETISQRRKRSPISIS